MNTNNLESLHSCKKMNQFLNDQRIPLSYLSIFNEYALQLKRSTMIHEPINYCPWCGCTLPKSLRQKFIKTVNEATSIQAKKITKIITKKNLPAEFKTQEWWKKRGL